MRATARVRTCISIHALREEGDLAAFEDEDGTFTFLSTPSVRRATRLIVLVLRAVTLFLSTPSVRRATRRLPLRHKGERIYFYPRPP